MLLVANQIRTLGIFTPFSERSVHKDTGMSYGLSYCGYDVRLAQNITLWPGCFKLASTLEHFSMPNMAAAEVKDKSTLARMGLAVQNTFIEPGWRGYLTLELTNGHPWWKFWKVLRLKAGQPIAQIVFPVLAGPSATYAGKYQDQENMPVAARQEETKP